jgi:DNA-binding SARP family transcriptional activator
MEFRLLGPLEIVDGGRPVQLNGGKARAALGLLLLRANQMVATNALLKALWPDEQPSTARKMLQNAISGVRAAELS